jgi:hypothetical protein
MSYWKDCDKAEFVCLSDVYTELWHCDCHGNTSDGKVPVGEGTIIIEDFGPAVERGARVLWEMHTPRCKNDYEEVFAAALRAAAGEKPSATADRQETHLSVLPDGRAVSATELLAAATPSTLAAAGEGT